MEQSPKRRIKKDFVNMAHRVDVSEEFKILFNAHALGVGESKNRSQRVANLTVLFWNLNTYKQALGFEDTEIEVVRAHKLIERGRFDKAVVQVSQDGTSKLVRDEIPNLLQQNESGQTYTYNKADDSQRLASLDQKLVEECGELMQAKDRNKKVEELADIYEVLAAIMKYRNIQMNEITPRLQTLETIQIMEKRRKLKNFKN